ncbi:MAG TPA: phosphoribosylformylglycinamidine synthase subunit PurL, partial [Aggregatilineales bacterium]|nr:phosphoribosylformylglycinamidine synthase subunit PurL [Aggregatilineales bacterium]
MQVFRIEIRPKHRTSSTRIVQSAHHLNITGVTGCFAGRLFFVAGDITAADAERLAAALLADPVTEDYHLGATPRPDGLHLIETTLHPGVTDPAAESLLHAAHLIGLTGVQRCATGARFEVEADATLTAATLTRLAEEILSNPVMQRAGLDAPIDAPFVPVDPSDDTVEVIAVRGLDDDALLAISQERRLSLDVYEMRAIRDYFEGVGRDPSDAELEMLAQTWSEHCVHKTFKANITYTGPAHGAPAHTEPVEQRISGLLKTYIRAATEQLDRPWVRSAFVDNAGIVRFDDAWDLAFKVETHNRPSALEPFGGANTGVGGVIRDVIGVSARPIANTDVLCFGPPDLPRESLPHGVLHPLRIADGVVAGIEDYGNKMGIPTVNGAIFYHPGYTANPLVFCGCLGILPHGSHRSTAQPDDLIVVIGGHTGRDGLRGATFSSMEMDTSTAHVSGGAVQIGHAINEKRVLEVVLRARDEGLYTAITDCGAGGLSSAVGEMGAELGATVQLERVPLKYPGLRPWEIWLSEAQERMVLAVPSAHWERFKAICDGQDVTAVAIGTFEASGQLRLRYGDKPVGDLSMHFLHDGIPTRNLNAVWGPPPTVAPPSYAEGEAYGATLLGLLGLPSIRSKEDVIRRYDHEVQTGTALKPLTGVAAAGPSDAAVLVPQDTLPAGQDAALNPRGVAIANAVAPLYGEIDPYAMAWASVDEALRNLVAAGADPDQVAILDNFSWGNANLPDRLGSLVRCSQGCYDAALAYGTPFVSGKDSLNNEYLGADGQRHAIPGTLVISAIGIVPDVTRTVSMDFKTTGNAVFLVGETHEELGGSHYHLLHGLDGGAVPQPNPDALDTLRALHGTISGGLVRACHDLSEGGLAVALAEMCIGGRVGASVDVAGLGDLKPQAALYAESATRFLVEVAPGDEVAFAAAFHGVTACVRLGTVGGDALVIHSGAAELASVPVAQLETAWRGQSEALAVG